MTNKVEPVSVEPVARVRITKKENGRYKVEAVFNPPCNVSDGEDLVTAAQLEAEKQRAVNEALEKVLLHISDDAYAITHQSVGAYRSALIRGIAAMKGKSRATSAQQDALPWWGGLSR